MELGFSNIAAVSSTSSFAASVSPGGQRATSPSANSAGSRAASGSAGVCTSGGSGVSVLSVLAPPATREVSSTGIALLHQELLLYALRKGGAAAVRLGSSESGPREAGGLLPPDEEGEAKGLSTEEEVLVADSANSTLRLNSRVLTLASENAAATLQSCGFRVGARVAERLTLKSSRMPEQRECVKFVCKDLWHFLFQKQADRLQTNRRGGYVIHDSSLPWLRRLEVLSVEASASSPSGASIASPGDHILKSPFLNCEATEEVLDSALVSLADSHPQLHVAFVCGIIRGALAALGLVCSVVAETPKPPGCAFQIRIPTS